VSCSSPALSVSQMHQEGPAVLSGPTHGAPGRSVQQSSEVVEQKKGAVASAVGVPAGNESQQRCLKEQ